MTTALDAHLGTYALNQAILARCIDGFAGGDWTRADAQDHTALWILGHLATCRRLVRSSAGDQPPPAAWTAAFAKGTRPADVPHDLDPGEVLADLIASGEGLCTVLRTLPDEVLGRSTGKAWPNGSDTLLGMVGFFAWHESYHLGQLGLLRRTVGKPGIA
jgi:hypothetical protein